MTKLQKQVLKRESGLELLRIITMFLIVMHHVFIHGEIGVGAEIFLSMFGKLGVNIFVLISAYFMVNKPFKLTRILNLVLRTTFYSIMIYLVFLISGAIEFTFSDLIYALFPVLYLQWWFVTAFVLLMFLSPVLNLVLKSVDKKTLAQSIGLLVSFTILFPYVSKILTGDYFEVPYLNELFFFIELYCIGGYIRLYGLHVPKIWVIIITIIIILYGMIATCFEQLGGERELYLQISSLSNFIAAVGLLLIFKDFKFQSRIVNTIASTTFGIYLIHENVYMCVWEYSFLCKTIFPSVNSTGLLFFLVSITIFVACMIIDFICLQTVHRIGKKFLQFIDKKIEHCQNHALDR